MSRGLLSIMAAVLFVALVTVTAGFESLLLDTDPIVESDAGPFLGPAMVITGLLVVFLTCARVFGVQARDSGTPDARAPRILVPTVVAGVVTYVVMLATGAGVYALERREAVWVVLFAGRYADSLFVVGSALWAAVAVALALLGGRYYDSHDVD